MPNGLHFTVGVVRDQPLPRCSDQISRMTADLQLLVVHAQETAMWMLLPPAREQSLSRLTPRELECLRWTMEGKTTRELGQILGIAEQTAVRHTHSAARKLDCGSKHQAVLKALRLKLIGSSVRPGCNSLAA